MIRLNIRTFRSSFSTLTEPAEVLRGTETIGWFYPGADNPIVAEHRRQMIGGTQPDPKILPLPKESGAGEKILADKKPVRTDVSMPTDEERMEFKRQELQAVRDLFPSEEQRKAQRKAQQQILDKVNKGKP